MARSTLGKLSYWDIDNYFNRRRRPWYWRIGRRKAKFNGYHRTIEDYFTALVDVGFTVDTILELEPYSLPKMSNDQLQQILYLESEYVKAYNLWRHILYMLFFRARMR